MERKKLPHPQLLAWVQTWQSAAQPLEAIRQAEIISACTEQALAALADAFESCRLHTTPLPDSGLVQQQALFRRLRP